MSDWVAVVVVVVVVVISNQLLLLNLGAVSVGASVGGGGSLERRGRCPRCGWAAPTNAPNENLSICTTFPQCTRWREGMAGGAGDL